MNIYEAETYGDLVALIREHRAPLDVFALFLRNVLPGHPAAEAEVERVEIALRGVAYEKAQAGYRGQSFYSNLVQGDLEAALLKEKQLKRRLFDLQADIEEVALAGLKGAADRNEPLSPRIGAYDRFWILERLLLLSGRAA